MSTESLSGQQLEQPLELEQEADGAAANGDGEPPLAKTSSKYKKKTKGEIIRENMPDKLMPRLIKWIQHLFTTFGRDVVIVMAMVYVMQGARTAFLYLAIDYACMDPNVGLGVSAGQAAVSAQPFAL